MRKLFYTAAILVIAFAVHAQSGDYKFNKESLVVDLRNFNYVKAKQSADLALGFEEAKSDAVIWYYAGNAYLHLHRLAHYMDFVQPGMDKTTVTAKMAREANRIKKDKKQPNSEIWYYNYENVEGIKSIIFAVVFENGLVSRIEQPEGIDYKVLGEGALQRSFEYYQTSLALNKQVGNPMLGLGPVSASEGMNLIAGQYYNEGVLSFNAKDFGKAAEAFRKTSEITEKYTQGIDTAATENAAISARLAKEDALAIEMYQKLISIGYKKPSVFLSLGELYKAAGKNESAFEVLKEGRSMFPDDFDLLISQTNLYLGTNRIKEAQDNLMVAVAKDPDNENLYYVIGTQYFDMLKTLDYNADTAAYFRTFNLASDYLNKAVELKPDYFEALYNLGALYVNEGVRVFEIADKLDPVREVKQYDKMKVVFDGHWAKAVGYMEKAIEQNPKDLDTLHTLRQLYVRFNNFEKVKEIDKLLKDLGAK